MTGDATNCIAAHTVPNRPSVSAARAVSPPRKIWMSSGSTGMTMPRASMSSMTVTKMKMAAARRDGLGAGCGVPGAGCGVPGAGCGVLEDESPESGRSGGG